MSELRNENDITLTGSFPRESVLIHPLVFSEHFNTEFDFTDKQVSDSVSWYYVRVIQKNGQLAWSSPVWVGKK